MRKQTDPAPPPTSLGVCTVSGERRSTPGFGRPGSYTRRGKGGGREYDKSHLALTKLKHQSHTHAYDTQSTLDDAVLEDRTNNTCE